MKIVIFNHSFFYLSETFIYRQVTGLPDNVNAVLLGFGFMNGDHFPTSNEKVILKKRANLADRVATYLVPPAFKGRFGFSVFNYYTVKQFLIKTKPDAIHAHFGFNAAIIYPLARLLRIPLVVSFHGVDASPEMLKDKEYKKMMKKIIAYAKAVIIVSPHMAETLELAPWKAKTHLIPYGVNANEFTASRRTGDRRQINILHSGRLVGKKGVPDLIRVFKQLSGNYTNVKLTIIGDGPELETCRQLAAGDQAIEFLGAQPQETVKRTMSEADIFVLNSRTSESGDMEGLPNAILEAMSMRLAVVSTYHAGIPQAMEDGINGLLVPEKDNEALRSALEKVIESADLRKKLGNAARRTVEDQFTIRQMNAKIADVYRKVNP